jgi:hypothetical protein
MSELSILSMLLRIYFQRNWEFGSALPKLRNFGAGGGGGFEHPHPGTPLKIISRFELDVGPGHNGTHCRVQLDVKPFKAETLCNFVTVKW